jgi:hypothetical protein
MSAPRSQRNFRKRDMRVAVEAVLAAGVPVARVDVNKDGFSVVAGKPQEQPAEGNGESEWDRG